MLLCFSPTGTTKKIIHHIAFGVNINCIEWMDITTPIDRQENVNTNENELLIVGVPVYMGRVPAIVTQYLHTINANNTPSVCVVVYGNRAYENALLELKDVLTESGCKPIAGSAYVGEHSFSSKALPSSVGRPDKNDVQHAEMFGRKIKGRLDKASSVGQLAVVQIPGSYPYGGVTDLWKLDFISVSEDCTQCGVCAKNCPTGAIAAADSSIVDKEKCTLCCACIKQCKQNAKSMKPGLMKEAAIRCTKFINRKEPELFLN